MNIIHWPKGFKNPDPQKYRVVRIVRSTENNWYENEIGRIYVVDASHPVWTPIMVPSDDGRMNPLDIGFDLNHIEYVDSYFPTDLFEL